MSLGGGVLYAEGVTYRSPGLFAASELPWVTTAHSPAYPEGVAQGRLCNAFSVMPFIGAVTQGRPLRDQPWANLCNRVAVKIAALLNAILHASPDALGALFARADAVLVDVLWNRPPCTDV